MSRVAGVELGGAKVLVAVGEAAPVRIATRDPASTLSDVVAVLERSRTEGRDFAAIGVASFGPLELDPASPRYGRLLTTPKPGWSGTDLLGPLARAFGVPLVLETDVNAAALAEARHAGRGWADLAYVTVGTGVGAGLMVAGRTVHGAGHPEAGHMPVRRRPGDAFPGSCPLHGDCAEGLVSGPALEARVGRPPAEVGSGHPCWELAGDYLAQVCMTLALTTAPARIVLGGGVGSRPELLDAARAHLLRHLGGYLDRYRTRTDIDAFLIPAALRHSGLVGALHLAEGLMIKPDPMI